MAPKTKAADSPVSSPSGKKAKTEPLAAAAGFTLNINNCVDKEHEDKSFKEIIGLPVSALQGLSEKADVMLKAFKVTTVEELANWKFFKIAKAIVVLAATEEEGGRKESALSNINAAVDTDYEKKSLAEIADAPVSALQGLAEWVDEHLKPLHIKSVKDLGSWKYCLWAESLVTLAAFENADFSSK